MNTVTKPVSILVIEDDDIDYKAIERNFKKVGIDTAIIRAKDGLHGLEILQSRSINEPYIVLLDLNMPRMGGLEFLKHIRNDDNTRNLVVFILSTSDMPSDVQASYYHNVAGYFLKSICGKQIRKVSELIKHYQSCVLLPKSSAV